MNCYVSRPSKSFFTEAATRDALKNVGNFTAKYKETPAQMFSCKICKFFKSTYIEEHLLLFFLLPLQILLTVIADWNRRSTNCKAILGLLTDLIFMPISASWNVNQMYYEFPPLKFGKISRNNGLNVTIVEIVNRKNQEFQSSCCICCYIWHHMLHFYICLSGNSPTTVVKR